jgi:hypothetical protein
MPLLTEAGGNDDENLPLAFRPPLGKENARFNRFSETNFIGEDRALRERRAEGE